MSTPEAASESDSGNRKLRLMFGTVAVLLGIALAFGIRFLVDQFQDEGSTLDASSANWPVYVDATQGYSIKYPSDGRVDTVDGVASITNRDLACPACEPAPLRMFALSITPDPPDVIATGQPIEIGDEGYLGTMTIDGDRSNVARIDYDVNGRMWRILATFTEPIDDANPATAQFYTMIESIHHP